MTINSRRIVAIVGAALGIVILIIGICVQLVDSTYASSTSVGKPIEFGADFYTEIYDVTKDVGEAVNNATSDISASVNNAASAICTAVGWLIISIGILDICFFTYKFFSADAPQAVSNTPVMPMQADPMPQAPLYPEQPYMPEAANENSHIQKDWWNAVYEQGSVTGQCQNCGSKKEQLVRVSYTDFFGSTEKYICYNCFCKKESYNENQANNMPEQG